MCSEERGWSAVPSAWEAQEGEQGESATGGSSLEVTLRSTVEAKGGCEWIDETERGGTGPREQRTLFQGLL